MIVTTRAKYKPAPKGRPARYPFDTMKRNESFTIPSEGKTLLSFRNYCTSRSRKMGKKFRVRLVTVDKELHFEVVRIS